MLSKAMGPSDWYIQIDSDEYFENFEVFVKKLQNLSTSVPTTVNCRVVTLFKKLASGYLLIDESYEMLSFATNNPVYDIARTNNTGNKIIDLPDLVLHQSWARNPDEIKLKLRNWSHKDDFNTDSFINLWDAIDEFNYSYLRNFHPLHPVTWPKLTLMIGDLSSILNSGKINKLRGEAKPIRRKLFSRLWKEIES